MKNITYKLQEELKRKSVILLSARVHPGEAPSSWIMRGILHFLTGDSQVAADLRDKFIFKVKIIFQITLRCIKKEFNYCLLII